MEQFQWLRRRQKTMSEREKIERFAILGKPKNNEPKPTDSH